ncbi:MAG: VWA domain-containing protein, partial [Phycisphaerales bacterium]|nr:VWA domain-containing protein [Phycisphaerales bacterium]
VQGHGGGPEGVAGVGGVAPTGTAAGAAERDIDLIVPSTRRGIFNPRPRPMHLGLPVITPIALESVAVKVDINGQVAVTELELTVHNPSSMPREAEMLLPVPDGAVVRSLQYDGTGPEPTARLLPREEARRIYDRIVRSMRDPALLEFAGQGVIRTSAFPVPAGARQKLRITFEQVLTANGPRLDWTLPRTESLAGSVPWTLHATVRSEQPIASVFSPSHELSTQRISPASITATATSSTLQHAGSLRISVLREAARGAANEPTTTVFATPDPDQPGSGYFMMLVNLPDTPPKHVAAVPREVTLVLDRSGSMQGPKFTQAINAAERVINALADGERFNIVDYSDSIASFKPSPIAMDGAMRSAAQAYIRTLEPRGGTNIRDALVEALRPAPVAGTLPITLFLTDGRPTTGETREAAIREAARNANAITAGKPKPTSRRVFTFGVGLDVNAPLLTALARDARGSTAFVTPDEDIEVAMSTVMDRLRGPTLAWPTMTIVEADGQTRATSIVEVMPAELPDYFAGEQIVLTGRYRSDAPVTVTIQGELLGQSTTLRMPLMTQQASMTHAFVSRAWATQRVAWLVEQIRTNYANVDVRTDPAGKELVSEIVRLSTRFGILTEYTAFLSTEPAGRLTATTMSEAARVTTQRTNSIRTGGAAVSQDLDASRKAAAPSAAGVAAASQRSNIVVRFAGGQIVEERLPVQNIASRAFFQRGSQWTQGDLIVDESKPADAVLTVGTDDYQRIADELIADGLASVLALPGEVLVRHRGKNVRLVNVVAER